tara:strand:+ start:5673 stop:6173 length:501 start_codon:yes stop_codon:yes gene_type:complete
MTRPDPIDYTSLAKWAGALIESNPDMTVIDFERECKRQGVGTGRTQYYKAVRDYRDKHGLGKLPRGGKNNPRPANYTDRGPTRKVVRAPVPITEDTGPYYGRGSLSWPHQTTKEANEYVVKLLLWMSKYNVRVITIEEESQEVTLSNEPSESRQLVPSPHFTIQGG